MMANLKDGDDSTAEPKPIAFENNEPSNEEAEALALSPIPENEKCEFQRSEKKKHEVILWPFWFLSKRQIKQERQTHDKAIRKLGTKNKTGFDN